MLVLSRKEDEAVVFPALGITVKVIDIRGTTVRLGFEAPRDIRIHRGEVQLAIEAGLAQGESILTIPPGSEGRTEE